jgi:tetratricopeptide (TPR) repeat protein
MRVRGASVVKLLAVVAGIGLATAASGCNKNAVDAQKLAKHAQSISGESPKEASEEYKQASQLDPQNSKILATLATLYEKQKDWANAAETWAKAAVVADDFASYHFRRGYSLYELARKDPGKQGFDKAIEPFKKAASKDPNLADAHYYLGKCLYEMDDEQGALEAYTKAIETKANELAYYVDLSNLYLDLGFAEQGLQVAQEGQKQAPNVVVKQGDDNAKAEAANSLYNLVLDEARAYELLQKPDDKIKALEKARTVPNPKNGAREAEFQLAVAYNDKGLAQDACQALTNYLKSPAGKSPEAAENRRDAETKKFQWKCPGQ